MRKIILQQKGVRERCRGMWVCRGKALNEVLNGSWKQTNITSITLNSCSMPQENVRHNVCGDLWRLHQSSWKPLENTRVYWVVLPPRWYSPSYSSQTHLSMCQSRSRSLPTLRCVQISKGNTGFAPRYRPDFQTVLTLCSDIYLYVLTICINDKEYVW